MLMKVNNYNRRFSFDYGWCLRRPKTAQEMRQYYVAEDFRKELEDETGVRLKIRKSRNPRNIPDAWDDLPVGRAKRPTKRQMLRSRRGRDSIRFLNDLWDDIQLGHLN
jgi:hypothetical protein